MSDEKDKPASSKINGGASTSGGAASPGANGFSVQSAELSLRGEVAANAPNAIEVQHIVKQSATSLRSTTFLSP